ncbi:MAG: alpha/beta hydrolase [Bacteroidetes bacterium]|nr:alpha/beta hydrolase [Bacteroidota bacterium]
MKYPILTLLLLGMCSLHAQVEHMITDGQNKIHLTTFGEGDPILIINGGPGMNSDGFKFLAESLSTNNQTIIYDQRGTGLSVVPNPDAENIRMDSMIQDIETIRAFLEIDKWIVLGHSFGGMLASYYTTHYPERVKGLILSSSGGLDMDLFSTTDIRSSLTETQRDSLSYWSRQIANGDTSYHALYQRGLYLAPAYLYDKSHVPVVAERLTQGNMDINRLVWSDMQRIGFDCKEALRSFQQPVLIIQGKEDIVSVQLAEKAAGVFPNAQLVILEKCSHYGWLDQPKLYFEHIDRFLRAVAG